MRPEKRSGGNKLRGKIKRTRFSQGPVNAFRSIRSREEEEGDEPWAKGSNRAT